MKIKQTVAIGNLHPIIVKFVRYADRSNVLSITESLTKERRRKFKEAKEQYGFKRVRVIGGKILFKEDYSPSTKPIVYYE